MMPAVTPQAQQGYDVFFRSETIAASRFMSTIGTYLQSTSFIAGFRFSVFFQHRFYFLTEVPSLALSLLSPGMGRGCLAAATYQAVITCL